MTLLTLGSSTGRMDDKQWLQLVQFFRGLSEGITGYRRLRVGAVGYSISLCLFLSALLLQPEYTPDRGVQEAHSLKKGVLDHVLGVLLL